MPAEQNPPPLPKALQELLVDLQSDDANIRRQSRVELTQPAIASNTKALLAQLSGAEVPYRTRLGVAVALHNARYSVAIADKADAQRFVSLIGDADVLIRKHGSEAMMKLTDPRSIDLLETELVELIARRDPTGSGGDSVYNAAVVLATWSRTLPPALSAKKLELTARLNQLAQELRDEPKWQRTRAVILELTKV